MAPTPSTPPDPSPDIGEGSSAFVVTRRAALSGAALLGLGAGLGAGLDRALAQAGSGTESGTSDSATETAETATTGQIAETGAFHGRHQAGIAGAPQGFLHFAAFDLTTSDAAEFKSLLADWTASGAALTSGRSVQFPPASASGPSEAPRPARPPGPADPGEADGLGAAGLTLTFGLGPGLFAPGRLGLHARRPVRLAPLPPFAGEFLDPARSGGDLCVQACADDPQVAFHAVHVLARLAEGRARLRWAQLGFRGRPAAPAQTPRNLLGFKDGTNNPSANDPAAMNRLVWLAGADGPAWMVGGTYLIVRRIALVLSTWDAVSVTEQERAIGRHKTSGAPLGRRRELDPVDLRATDAQGTPVIPADAHIRLADPHADAAGTMLRRGYSYSAGTTEGAVDRGGHQMDAGLFFIAFVRDPAQFIAVQRRLATGDALNAFAVHTASAVFACPPGAQRGGVIAGGLFAT
jgi:deferrochelatase/peroxidase EfeB